MSRPITRRAAMAASLGWLLAAEIATPVPKRARSPARPPEAPRHELRTASLREIDEHTW